MLNNYKYGVDPFKEYLKQLAQKLACEYNDDEIRIAPTLGSGYVKSVTLEENFCVRYFNFTFNEDVAFDVFTQYNEPAITYRLLFNLDGKEIPKHDRGTEFIDFNSDVHNLLLYSSDVVRNGVFRKNYHYRRMIILFTDKWLNENYAEAGLKMTKLVQGLISKNTPTILAENIDIQNRFIVTQLANEMDKNVYTNLHVKTAAFILLNDILNKIVQRNRQDILSNQTLHYETMVKVEQKIMKFINQKLPNIDEIAKEYNISLSTLKRHFRIVYGKNIYQYYQERRLEWGKAELEKGNTTIAEIATQLGFYKVNNFSIAFKKYFGILPREIKSRKFINLNY